MMTTELLPCPWCGPNEYPPTFALNELGNHIIECGYCGVQKCEQTPREINQARQIREWNERWVPPALSHEGK